LIFLSVTNIDVPTGALERIVGNALAAPIEQLD